MERKKKRYRVLTSSIKEIVRKYYKDVVKLPKNRNVKFYEYNGTLFSNGYERIVIGDHGAYFEFKKDQIMSKLTMKMGEDVRDNRNRSKFLWMETPNATNVYEQTKVVKYADYKPGFFYVDTNDLMYLQQQ